jgi:hypothetical protein
MTPITPAKTVEPDRKAAPPPDLLREPDRKIRRGRAIDKKALLTS